MPPDPLSALEKGLRIVEDPNDITSPTTESSTIASCPKEGLSQSIFRKVSSPAQCTSGEADHLRGSWSISRVRECVGSFRPPRFPRKRDGLRIDGAMGTTAIPKREHKH